MHKSARSVLGIFTAGVTLLMHGTDAWVQTKTQMPLGTEHNTHRDGQHDFDFEFGTWKTHLKRLLHPLTDSTIWVDYDGTTTVRKLWGGRANLVELEVDGPKGHIEALSRRLYNPDSQQWSLNFANSAGGTMATPPVGEFKNGRGEFMDPVGSEVLDCPSRCRPERSLRRQIMRVIAETKVLVVVSPRTRSAHPSIT